MLVEPDEKIFITGTTGFVGVQLLRYLSDHNYHSKILSRTSSVSSNNNIEVVRGDLENIDKWFQYLGGCSAVIHLAARVHIMKDTSKSPLEDFRKINTYATLNLARQAAVAGVKRFIFLSSIKVSGEETDLNQPFKSSHKPNPVDPYAMSKFEAEEGLMKLSEQTGMEVIIIRPPLVYGSGVKGNFASLLKYASKGIPLPFGSIKDNRRSIVSVDNLVDLIVTCIDHPNAANRVFLVSDGEDVSTAQIYQQLSKSFGKRGFMLPMPLFLYKIIGMLIGKPELISRLCGNLQVDISDTKSILSWKPIVSVQGAFDKMAKNYLRIKKNKDID